MPSFEIRLATFEEYPAIVALVNSAYRGDSSRAGWTTEADILGGQRTDVETLREQLATGDTALLLAAAEGRVVGCVCLERAGSSSEVYLGMLTIDPQQQGSGLGRALLAYAERYAIERWRATSIKMTVIALREELIAWYGRRGYERTSEREPFPYGDARFGVPKRNDLYFEVLRKPLADGKAST